VERTLDNVGKNVSGFAGGLYTDIRESGICARILKKNNGGSAIGHV